YPLQPTIWPMFTRWVSRASAAVVVQHSNTVFLVGSGTVWKWSYSQIESHEPPSATFATAVIASHCSTGSSILTRFIRQPCGTKTPNLTLILFLILSMDAHGNDDEPDRDHLSDARDLFEYDGPDHRRRRRHHGKQHRKRPTPPP